MRKMKRKKKKHLRRLLAVGFVSLLSVAVLGVLGLYLLGKWGIEITLHGEQDMVIEVGSTYTEEGAEAYYGSRRFAFFERTDVEVTVEGTVDTAVPGTYRITYRAANEKCTETKIRTVIVADTQPPVITLEQNDRRYTPIGAEFVEEGFSAYDEYEGDVTDRVAVKVGDDGYAYYTVSDKAGNTATVKRQIRYDDRTAPVITLTGDTLMLVDLRKEYEEPGFTAADDVDGDLTAKVSVTTKPGANESETIYSYEVTDEHGNVGWATRIVQKRDLETPYIKLTGGESVKVYMGDRFHEPGFKAYDYTDGDLTELVEVEGEIDNFTEGAYTYTYRVTDTDGNEGIATREVLVVPREKVAEVKPEGKIIYLTFDDGPCIYTEKLLDVLAKYDVKATFFVTNQFPNYQYLIKREAEEGHTVAVHSYSHVYGRIYKSREAYLEDLNMMNDIIEEQTGKRATIIRFPGGSSNAVSRQYCVGIMSDLTSFLTEAGFQYQDWNIPSGDSDGATTAAEVFNNVKRYVQNYNISIVLQHDIKGFSVDAVEQIIVWGLENGYTFLPLQPDSPTSHHRLNN
ncbi:MAG: DUF5011 domain-containing protein [Lachnospiraceae bacterium]|nr:DUF5011 domain-containing protein [Lachnospiraceae bacterium]